MIKVIAGLVFGYLIYTPDGKKILNNAGNYLKDNLKASMNELNKSFTKNKKEHKNERIDRDIQTNDERSFAGENVCAESVGLQKNSNTEVNGIYINSAKEN